jgi:hypothetical protein
MTPQDKEVTMAETPQAEFAARVRDSRQLWRSLVAEVGDRADDPGPMGAWTFGDLAGHLLAWRNRTIARLEAAGRGEPEPPAPWPTDLEGEGAINSWIREQDRGRSSAEMIDAYDESFERLGTAAEALPAELVSDPSAFLWLEGNALGTIDPLGHLREEHEPTVRAWLSSRSS